MKKRHMAIEGSRDNKASNSPYPILLETDKATATQCDCTPVVQWPIKRDQGTTSRLLASRAQVVAHPAINYVGCSWWIVIILY